MTISNLSRRKLSPFSGNSESTLSSNEILRRITLDNTIDIVNAGEIESIRLNATGLETIERIHQCVADALQIKASYLAGINTNAARRSFFNRYGNWLSDLLDLPSDVHWEYNHLTLLLYGALEATRQLHKSPANAGNYQHKSPQTLCTTILQQLHALSHKEKFRKIQRRLEQRSNQNLKSASAYIYALIEKYSKLLVLRIDFSWQSKFAKYVTEDDAKASMERMLNNRRRNKLFKPWVGYIAKLEYGVHRGYHYHLIIFLDGQAVQRDEFFSRAIGNYWNEVVTQGSGLYFSCNTKLSEQGALAYKRVGIGMIDYTDSGVISILLNDVLAYLCKKEQFLPTKAQDKRGRVFSTGILSRKKLSNVGRPRKYLTKHIE